MDDKTTSISISIPENLHKLIKELAKQDQRSVSSMIAKILTDHVNSK